MKAGFTISFWTLIMTLSSTSLAVPTPDAKVAVRTAENPIKYVDISELLVNETTLERRGGFHEAKLSAGYSCDGVNGYYQGFGCGGVCYQGLNANSVMLTQENTNNPKPTAELYTSNDCTGSHSHAGIWNGYYQGCTNTNIGTWHSAYFYFNC